MRSQKNGPPDFKKNLLFKPYFQKFLNIKEKKNDVLYARSAAGLNACSFFAF
jgi:hypothetical protein